MQNETLGHRGRKVDPLYKIRKLLLTGAERVNEKGQDRVLLGLRAGDPNNEVLGAWLAKESVRDVYLATNRAQAELLLDKTIAGCQSDPVAEVRSLGRTLKSWRKEILAYHDTGASNGPTEGLNLCIKKVKRCGLLAAALYAHHRVALGAADGGHVVMRDSRLVGVLAGCCA